MLLADRDRKMLKLRKLTEKTDVYGLTEEKIRLITTASALHDIGKISIPENIRIQSTDARGIQHHPHPSRHRAHPCSRLTQYRDEPLVGVAIEICQSGTTSAGTAAAIRTACLRTDPDLGAGVVALADVFDALTMTAASKKAHTPTTPLNTMILNGECGASSTRCCLRLLMVEISMRLRERTADACRRSVPAATPKRPVCRAAAAGALYRMRDRASAS